MTASNRHADVVVDRGLQPFASDPNFRGRQEPMCCLRNYMVTRYLKPYYTHVLWLDSDLEDYPFDLLQRLLDVSRNDIVAPAAMAGDTFDPNKWGKDRWYDTHGFVEKGKPARLHKPWFKQVGPVIELESVGMCYLVPADVYRKGGRYEVHPKFTEHYSLCHAARQQGRKILCDLRIKAKHINLEPYEGVVH